MYSLKQIAETIKRTPQSVYRLFNSNKELNALLEGHTIRDGHKVYYDEVIYNWFCSRYMIDKPAEETPQNQPLVESGVGVGQKENENPKNPDNTPAPSPDYEAIAAAKDETIAELRQRVAEYQTQIEGLEHQLAEEKKTAAEAMTDLSNQINQKEGERIHFISENAKLTAILAAEKQEKQKLIEDKNALEQRILLLEAPRRQSLGQRIKAFFSRNNNNEGAANNV